MRDTSEEMEEKYREIIMQKTPYEHLQMGASMHETA